MPLTLSCPCGQQMRVADAQAGQQVRCPACFQILQVPGDPPAPANGLVQFSCTCGTVMKAKAEHAGQLTACPRCQSKVAIPGASTPAPAPAPAPPPQAPAPPPPPPAAVAPPKRPPTPPKPASAPKKASAGVRPAPPPPPVPKRVSAPPPVPKKKASRPSPPPPPPSAAITDDPGNPLDFRSSPIERAPRYARRRGIPWMSILFLLLLMGGAGAGVYWWFWLRASPVQQSLSLVPDDAQLFISVRVADVWKTGVVQKALEPLKDVMPDKQDPVEKLLKEMELEFGLSPADLDQVTRVVMDIKKPQEGILIIASSRPLDRKKIVNSRYTKGPEEIKRDDKVYYASKAGGTERNAIHFVNNNICLAGTEKQIVKALTFELGRKPKGTLAPAIELAAQHKHDVVIGARLPEDLKKLGEGLPVKVEGADSLLAAQSAMLVLDFDGPALTAELTARYSGEDVAGKAKAAAEKTLPLAKMFLLGMAGELKGKLDKKVEAQFGEQMKAVVDSIQLEEKGADVTVRVRVPDVQAMVALPIKVAQFLFVEPPQRPRPNAGPPPSKKPDEPKSK